MAETPDIMPVAGIGTEFIRTHQTEQPFCDKQRVAYQINLLLNEIHATSHELIDGMTGEQNRPIARAYWAEGDVNKRMGEHADTFLEFREQVDGFIDGMAGLLDNTLVWFAGLALNGL